MIKINAPQKLNIASIIAGGSVLTVIVIVISLFWGKILVGNLTQNNKVLSKKRQAEQTLAKNLDAIGQLQTEYESLGPKKEQILNALPTSANFPGIVSLMENLSKNAGVNLQSVTPSESSETASSLGPTEYTYHAAITGAYSGFKSFLKNIELSARPLSIRTMKINGTSNQLTVDVEIKTYFQSPYDLTLKTVPLKEAK